MEFFFIWSIRYSCQILVELAFIDKFLQNTKISNFMMLPSALSCPTIFTIIRTRVGEHKSVSSNVQSTDHLYRGRGASLLVPKLFTLWISTTDCLLVLECLPLSRETGSLQEKNNVKVSLLTKEHLRTAFHCFTRKRIQTLHGNEACQTSTQVAPVRCKCGEHLWV